MLAMLKNTILGLVGHPLVVWGSDSFLGPHPMSQAPSYMLAYSSKLPDYSEGRETAKS